MASFAQRLHERLSDAQVADFARDGAICIKQLLKRLPQTNNDNPAGKEKRGGKEKALNVLCG